MSEAISARRTMELLAGLGYDPELSAARTGADPQPYYVKAAAETPVRRNDDGSVTVFRMADIQALNRHKEVLGNGHSGGGIGAVRRRLIPLDLDGPDHRKYRKLLDPHFTAKKLAHLEPLIREQADAYIDPLIEQGEADVFDAWCERLPSTVFLSLMGIPMDELDDFLEFKNAQLHPDLDQPIEKVMQDMTDSAERCYGYFERVIDERQKRGDVGDDMIGRFLSAEIDGERLSRDDILDISYLMMIAGLDTVAASLACILAYLARHPDQRRWILEDPGRWPSAIEELLRFESPVADGYRKPLVDIELSGEKIEAGTLCNISWAAANLDPEVFPDPLRVDLERSPNAHIAFASGFHRCLGSHLARMELRVALERFHERIPEYELAVPAEELVFFRNPRTPERLPLCWK
ncbi:MAG: cytochrome P450 [Acidobacteriota bacterium]|nr:cytochrome P450 [Acidobacteriota bacterium]